MRKFVFGIAVPIVIVAAMNCGSSPSAPSPPELRGGLLATFAVGSELFKVWITNPATIDRVLALRAGGSGGSIPNGRIRRGAGRGDHNAPFNWHLDPVDTEIVDLAIEVCDGRPSYVEANIEEYVNTIARYCPWGALLVSAVDYR